MDDVSGLHNRTKDKIEEFCQGEKLCISILGQSILGQILYLFIGLDPVLYFVRSCTRPVER